jgi:hypothetical protein
MSSRLTDQAVSELPLAAGRAELLEEIMATSLDERATPSDPAARHLRRWAATLAAAAAAAALVAVPSWLLSRDQPTSVYAAPTAHQWVVLDAPGWTVSYVSDPGGGESEVEWENAGASLTVHLRDADSRDGYVEDRERIDAPTVDPGTPVELLGRPALSWSYSADDRTTIGAVEDGTYPEVRGTGMGRQAYLELLARLAWTDEAGFEAALPEEFVTAGEADATVTDMLRGIPLAPGAAVPSSGENDPYQLGADVARQVACPWIEEFDRARRAGDRQAVRRAKQVLGTSRDWTFLQVMDAEGDYPEVLWEMSDEVVAGRVPVEYAQGLGCD